MSRFVFPLVAAVLLLGDGLLFGRWTNRWQTPEQLAAAVASLKRVPLVIGDWEGQPLPPLSDRAIAQTGFADYLQVLYANRRTGAAVNVLLACGPFGPMSVHSPEVCYEGNGFIQQGDKTSYTEDLGKPAQFWTARFAKTQAIQPVNLKVYWSWNAGGEWQAPRNPRWVFGGEPVLFKLYLSHGYPAENDNAAKDDYRAFIRIFLAELDKNLAFKL